MLDDMLERRAVGVELTWCLHLDLHCQDAEEDNLDGGSSSIPTKSSRLRHAS